MKTSTQIKFVKSREEDGCFLYDLIIDGKVVETDLDLQKVVEKINAMDEDRATRHTRTPEEARKPFSKRNLPRRNNR